MAGESAILEALYVGDRARAEELAAGADDLDIFEAAGLGRAERLRRLLDDDPLLVNCASPGGFLPLQLAAFFSEDPSATEVLLSHGADPGAPSRNEMAVTALNSAAAQGHRTVCEVLLDAGADVHAAQTGGYTALHSAAANGDEDLVQLLLSRQADPSQAADDGRLPCDLAEERGHAHLGQWLRQLAAG